MGAERSEAHADFRGDTIAANGVHGALLIGPRHPIAARAGGAGQWQAKLSRFDIDLLCDGRHIDRGNAANVLDGPLAGSAIWSGCWRMIRSIRRSPPARS